MIQNVVTSCVSQMSACQINALLFKILRGWQDCFLNVFEYSLRFFDLFDQKHCKTVILFQFKILESFKLIITPYLSVTIIHKSF